MTRVIPRRTSFRCTVDVLRSCGLSARYIQARQTETTQDLFTTSSVVVMCITRHETHELSIHKFIHHIPFHWTITGIKISNQSSLTTAGIFQATTSTSASASAHIHSWPVVAPFILIPRNPCSLQVWASALVSIRSHRDSNFLHCGAQNNLHWRPTSSIDSCLEQRCTGA